MHFTQQVQHKLNVISTMSSLPDWRIAAVRVKGFRSVSAWLEVDLPRGNLMGIVGPNGGVKALKHRPDFVMSCHHFLLGALAFPTVPQAAAKAHC